MKSSPKITIKIIQGISLLTLKELNEFKKFTISKYYSKDREYSKILILFSELHKNNFLNFDNKKLLIFLSEKLKIGKQSLLNRLSELYKIFEMFLISKKLEQSPHLKNNLLLEIFLDKKSHKLFEYTYNTSKIILEKSKFDNKILSNKYDVQSLAALNFFYSGKYDLFTELFSGKSYLLVADFFQTILKYSIETMQQQLIGKKSGIPLVESILSQVNFDSFLKEIKKIDLLLHKYLSLLHYMYLSYKDFEKTEFFHKARKLHINILSELSRNENHIIYFVFITYCINQTNFKKINFYDELFELINEKLDGGYIDELKENNLPVNNFRDYIIIGLRLGKLNWVKSFIEKYSQYLPAEFKQDEINMGAGIVALEEKKFELAIEILSKVKKKNYIYYFDSAYYKIRAYYELRNQYEAFMEVDRLKQYMNYHKDIPIIHKESFLEQINNIVIILKLADNQINISDFKYYFKDVNLSEKKKWIVDEVNKILKK